MDTRDNSNSNQQSQQPQDLRTRTKLFARRIIHLRISLPKTEVNDVLGRQLLRSGTSIGAHYREASRSKSVRDFISKLETAIAELDESMYWMEILTDEEIVAQDRMEPLLSEANELIAIFISIVKKQKEKLK